MKRRKRAHGLGSVTKRGDGRYEVRITTPDGRKSFYRKTEREAEDLLTQLRAGRAQASRQHLADFAAEWLETVVRPTIPRSYAVHEANLRLHLLPSAGRLPLAEVSPRRVAQLQRDLLAKGLAPNTARSAIGTLSAVLATAEQWELIARNPCRLVRPIPRPQGTRRALAPEQAQRFMDAMRSNRLGTLFVVGLTAGARLGELTGLRWRDVDLEAGRITIAGQLNVVPLALRPPGAPSLEWLPTKTQQPRVIALTARGVEALRLQHELQEAERRLAGGRWYEHPQGLVWTGRTGQPLGPTTVRYHFARHLTAAGLGEMVVHELRHSANTLAQKAGAPLSVVMDMLGHKNPRTTVQVYTHVDDADRRDLAARMDRLLGVPPAEGER